MPVHDVAAAGFGAASDVYERARPTYPPDAVAWLVDALRLHPGATAVDLAAGTGKLTRLLTPTGARVIAVEPVAGMRRVLVATQPGLPVLAATAEALALRGGRVDAVTVAQAFHWFDPAAARSEFTRILKPGGHLVLVWNERAEGPGFQADYDTLVRRYAPEISRIQHDAIDCVFGGPVWRLAEFENRQELDLEGLQGRLASSSYAPLPGGPGHQEMLDALAELFAAHQVEGRVTLLYDTKVYW